MTPEKRRFISRKIRLLRREGKKPKQAAAIAYRMAGVARRKRKRKKNPGGYWTNFLLVASAVVAIFYIGKKLGTPAQELER